MSEKIFLEEESKQVNYFLQHLTSGELLSLTEYCKDLIVGYLEDVLEEDMEDFFYIEDFILSRLDYEWSNGGIEIWYNNATNHIAKWLLEEGIEILQLEKVKMFLVNEDNRYKNVCLLHYAIVLDRVQEILSRLPEGAIMETDIEAFLADVKDYQDLP